MTTLSFHFPMLFVTVGIFFIFYFWPHKRSAWWSFSGLALAVFLGLLAVAVLSRLFRSNVGQCLAEGITFQGGIFLLAATVVLVLRKRRVLAVPTALCGLLLLILGFDALVYEPRALVLEHYEIRSPKIRSPLRIVFIADIQTDNITQYEIDTFHMVMEQKPHLILLGGDYLQIWKDAPPSTMPQLENRFRALFKTAPLEAPLGVYAIRGNIDISDSEPFKAIFEDTGVIAERHNRTISDLGESDKAALRFGPIDLTLISCENSYGGYTGSLPDSGNFQVMVGHVPGYFLQESRRISEAPDLLLAGHIHGGQVVLPGIGILYYHPWKGSEGFPKAWLSGFHPLGKPEDNKWVLTTRGTGMERGWAPRVRFCCRPEISVIDLLPGESATQPGR